MFKFGEQTMMYRDIMFEGIYYPSDTELLRSSILHDLNEAQPSIRNANVVLVPHASLEICGMAYAHGIKAMSDYQPETIIIAAQAFSSPQRALFLPQSRIFNSPFGSLEVDEQSLEEVLDSFSLAEENDIPHLQEAGIELVLPYIKLAFPHARILPILLGDRDEAVIKTLNGLTKLLFSHSDRKIACIACSNLSTGFDKDNQYQKAERLIEDIIAKKPQVLRNLGVLSWIAQLGLSNHLEVLLRGSHQETQEGSGYTLEFASLALSV